MAHLINLTKYDIKDSNIALLGSDLEKRVREHAGDSEVAWQRIGQQTGTQVWRIEQFAVKEWPQTRFGCFYDGDSYIVLHTYKKTPEAQELSYDLHFWLGEDTTQDEAGTAAYKTVELDDHLGGIPVQYREVQSYESPRFLSYFPRFVCLRGGVATGFHHVSSPPPENTHRLYQISAIHLTGHSAHSSHLQVREVPAEGSSLIQGRVYVLDLGSKIWQFNTRKSVGKERYKAAEFVQSLVNERHTQCATAVYDEHGEGAGKFLSALGIDSVPDIERVEAKSELALFRLSDATGTVVFELVSPPARSTLSSDDAFLLDDASNPTSPAIYVWIGSSASLAERRLALQYGQWYLYNHRQGGGNNVFAVNIVKMKQGNETESFLQAIGA